VDHLDAQNDLVPVADGLFLPVQILHHPFFESVTVHVVVVILLFLVNVDAFNLIVKDLLEIVLAVETSADVNRVLLAFVHVDQFLSLPSHPATFVIKYIELLAVVNIPNEIFVKLILVSLF